MLTLIYVVLGFVSLLLCAVVLIQDSKAGGLSGAFGGGGGDSLLGAHGQKDLAKVTSVLAFAFFVLAILGGSCAMREEERSVVGESPTTSEIAPGSPGSPEGGAPDNETGTGGATGGGGAPGTGTAGAGNPGGTAQPASPSGTTPAPPPETPAQPPAGGGGG
ncbi:MAG: preprotein translocase subunit SecG [Planctomycetes bacterium]|nr:preprotein translocase subunit SecG [Planctomycetota bacterium]